MKNYLYAYILIGTGLFFTSCDDDDAAPSLEIPTEYISVNYDANVSTEATVISELSSMTTVLNDAESSAQTTMVSAITYPENLAAVTLSSYSALVSGWLVEVVNASNDDDAFQNPGIYGLPASGEQGGLLGSRLLDENGLELEQMVQKGSFGAALYNHALDLISNGDLTDPSTIDRLVEIHGTSPSFDPDATTAAATYSRRRSNQTTQTGPFYDLQLALITSRTAAEAGMPSFQCWP